MNNGYIYIRTHKYYENDKICKLGRTKNIPDRDNQYATGEYKRGRFELVIEILKDQLYDDIYVEKILEKYFKNYHLKKDGGSEFYNNIIINEIVLFLYKTIIKFKVLTEEEIKNLIHTERIKKIKDILKKYFHNKQLDKRNRIQNKYVIDILNNLHKNNKVLVKAPTGFGKTIIMYKTINKLQPKKILIFTPRLNLNKQFVEDKYTKHLITKYKYEQYSIESFNKNNSITEDIQYKNNLIKKISLSNKNIILLSCYQSRNSLIKNIQEYNLHFDLVIFDEAHFISGWIEKIKDIKDNKDEIFLLNDYSYFTNKIFTTATPINQMILNNNIFGNLVEKVKIYELVNDSILCKIETIIKKLDNKKYEYADLSKLIEKSMINYNKRKGIIYVNNCQNAENLYNLIKIQNIIKPYIYISKDIEDIDSEEEKNNFELNNDKSVIIAVGKIGYGYDNDDIDFICFGDPRTSDIDIRQIVGRGLRWNKINYPDKILHILVPCYKNELENYNDNKALESYINYIISEYGNDDISKIIINKHNKDDPPDDSDDSDDPDNPPNGYKKPHKVKKYDGDGDIPIEIYKKWCTTGNCMYSIFILFLKDNNIYDEISYNKLKEIHDWIVELNEIQNKYPKFCFRDINPNNKNYYWNKKDSLDSYNICNNKLINDLGKEKYRKYSYQQKLNKITELDKKIPNINFDLYYPKN